MTLAKTANQSTVTVSGHDVELHKGGSGPPLLFLHGGGGFGTYDPTTGPLAENFTVYAPSHPGFFGTARPDWLYTIRDAAHFTKDLARELGLNDYVLAGHSIGGWIAAEMAAMDSHNIKALVLIDAAGIRPEKGEITEIFMVSDQTRLKLAFHDPAQVPNYDFFTAERTPEEAAVAHGNMEMLSRLCWKPYLHNPSLPHYLAGVSSPALVVWGKDDAIIPVECGEMYAKFLPNATLKTIDNCGHSPQMEKPQEFNDAVSAFLGELK
ncbi:MAG: alpha/beta hydrolase [Chloroflexi bacterium]|nr:alpha/beta hydrolase [Chloroflexota bacterium]MDA1270494.1 alpha/beta hydrolase [Chloroflexota bacterium]